MPYYRIIIWTRLTTEPLVGIRLLANTNVDDVYMIYRLKARDKFRYQYIDIEVQMLSEHSTAIHEYLQEKKQTRNGQKRPSKPFPLFVAWRKGDSAGLDEVNL